MKHKLQARSVKYIVLPASLVVAVVVVVGCCRWWVESVGWAAPALPTRDQLPAKSANRAWRLAELRRQPQTTTTMQP
jgi:hypothetical protein